MAKNKAFVRYANNKAVPGSLIVRKKAPSVGVWKEIDYDLCCGGGGNCCETTEPIIYILENDEPYTGGISIQMNGSCLGNGIDIPSINFGISKDLNSPITTPPTFLEIISLINQYFNNIGITAVAVDENTALVTITNPSFFACHCVNAEKILEVKLTEPA